MIQTIVTEEQPIGKASSMDSTSQTTVLYMAVEDAFHRHTARQPCVW